MDQPETDEISHPARIRQLLQRAANQSTPLQVSLQGSSKQWHTTLSRFDAREDSLIYNQLTPAGWELEPGFTAIAFLHSTEHSPAIAFSTTLHLMEPASGLRYLTSDVPDQLQYRQLRNDHRIDLSSRRATAHIQATSQQDCEGQLLDLSRGGFRVRLSGDDIQLGDPNQPLLCKLCIPGHSELQLTSRICNLMLSQGALDLSLEVSLSDATTTETLNLAINELERSTMRTLVSRRSI